MMIVGGNSVANDLPKNFRATAARGLEFFQREQGRAFAQHHTGAVGIEGSTFFRRRRLQRIEANKHELGERVITASQNALVAAGANRVKSVTDCVCARGASIRDYLSWSVDAKSFHGIIDLGGSLEPCFLDRKSGDRCDTIPCLQKRLKRLCQPEAERANDASSNDGNAP